MATTYFGIDCAKWQGTIDWAKVKKAGVKFAILKGTQKNNTAEDAFERNYKGCAAQSIPVGVYRYVYAKTATAATAEAEALAKVLKGREITCGVWLDMEEASIRGIGKAALNAVIAAERKVLESAGYKVGIYCNQDWYNNVLDVEKLDLPFWIARYGTNNGKQQTQPVVKSKHTLWGWQYSSKGKVSGISGNVDVNVSYELPGAEPDPSTGTNETFVKYKIVNCKKLTVRKSASINSAAICVLDAGETVRVVSGSAKKVSETNNATGKPVTITWFKIKSNDNRYWMSSAYLEKVDSTNVTTGSGTSLKNGDRGKDVKLLQQRLTICGWPLNADGIWGVQTESAVRSYQYQAGLTVDGIVGPNTQAKLIQDAIIKRATDIAAHMITHKWRYKGDGYTAKSTFAATKKLAKPGSSCAHFVSWVLQDVGLLKAGKVLSHSKAGYGTGAKSIVNANQLMDCTVTYPNRKISEYQSKLQPGDVLVHDSSIGIYAPVNGKPAILTAREGQPINEKKQYVNLIVKSGYEWKRDILALVRAKV